MSDVSAGDAWNLVRKLASAAKTQETDEFDGMLTWFMILFCCVVACTFCCAGMKAFRSRHSVAEDFEKASTKARVRDPQGNFIRADDDTPRDSADVGLLREAATAPNIPESIPEGTNLPQEEQPKKQSMKQFRFDLGTDFKDEPKPPTLALPGDVEAPVSPKLLLSTKEPVSPKRDSTQSLKDADPSSPKTPKSAKRAAKIEEMQKQVEDKLHPEAMQEARQRQLLAKAKENAESPAGTDFQPKKKEITSTSMPKKGVSVREALGLPADYDPDEPPEDPYVKQRKTVAIRKTVSQGFEELPQRSQQNPGVPIKTWLSAAEDAQRSILVNFGNKDEDGDRLDKVTCEAAAKASKQDVTRREETEQRQALALVAQAEALHPTQGPGRATQEEELMLREALQRSEIVQHASDEDFEAALKLSEEDNVQHALGDRDMDEAIRRSMQESTYPYAQHGVDDMDTDLQEAINRSVEEAEVMEALNEQHGASSCDG